MAADPLPRDSFLQSSEDPLHVSLAYGTATGITCVLVGYPLDTAKVRLQMGHPPTLGLLAKPYCGMLSQLLSVSPSWTASFLVYGAAIKGFSDDSLPYVVASGAIAGLSFAAVCCPFEMAKCNAQGSKAPLGETCRRLYKTGGLGILYRGFGACTARDMGGGGAYYFIAEMSGRSEWLRQYCGSYTPFVVGGLTGLGHYHVELPFDCIKTRMQTNLRYSGYGQVIGELFQDGPARGVRNLFRGYVPNMSEAVICHGISFCVLSKMRDLVGW